jgi:hypothetical protein
MDVKNAVASMMSDLNSHPETALKSPGIGMLGIMAAANNDVKEARRFIDGFN